MCYKRRKNERGYKMPRLDEKGLKKTPLYDYYLEKGLDITDFSGWGLPIQFTKIKEEHQAVRDSVGLFDAGHMGEVRITGEKALEFVNGLITNDATKVEDNQAMYTAVTNEEGGTLDDVIFYKRSDEWITFTPNASNTEKIYNWFVAHNTNHEVEIENVTDDYGLIAIQGPKAEAVLQKVTDIDLATLAPFHYLSDQEVAKVKQVVISRTGYTGEDGFELYMPYEEQLTLWKHLLEAGAEFDILECGLGARDTLRLEAGLALYGNDLSESINPIEGGIGFVVKTGEKKAVDYPGKSALEAYRKQEDKQLSRGFELIGRGIARSGMLVQTEDSTEIGVVTSGTKSLTFNKSIGYVLVDKKYADYGNEVYINIRNKPVAAKIVKKDWLRR